MQLHRKFIKVARANKNKIAIYDNATGKELTYNKLLIGSLILASFFKKSDEQYIGVMVPTSAGGILSILAILMAGKTPVMINYSTGAQQNCDRARSFIGFNTIVTSKKLLDKLEISPDDDMVLLEDLLSTIGSFKKISAVMKSKLPLKFVHNGSDDEVCIVLFTSGSEKSPKAVPLTHNNISSNIEGISQHFDLESNDIYASVLPLFHVFGLTTTFWLPLLTGASLIAFANPLEYKTVVREIKRLQATTITATPTFFNGYNLSSSPKDLSSIRVAVSGGDKLSPVIKESFYKKHGVELLEGYGTTETSPVISANTSKHNKSGSIGKKLPNVEVKIIDFETDEELSVGNTGKIFVKGENVMKGYLHDIEETSLRLHKGWYDTGDMGFIDEDGFIWHKGRLKRFLKIGGEMISLPNIEYEVEKLLPSASLCCAVEIPHPSRGAEIWLAVTGEFDEKDLKKSLGEVLPPISMPKKIIKFKELPLMGSGKVNFREVTALCRKVR
ncbi:MAG: bifunctional acyl-ACP--phospholipid O-acyltransferase/long-chain-fatty-acid--ACP ligase [Candidatus Cloacimonadota bacterium]|nr:MAG: bifunctional acyl-ACP--phospholipid O-acyltransferase/long-chain-fatty-acid--ACP ligase [Candidatus Cloacimonadota bacterium]PIE78483.1 MAG: bifunctional acyl-ACP--phospholipid O-acyltransferase/long-chain-fatty-acid--ACP ligase [Candidatus Delongbacteria bacterium]